MEHNITALSLATPRLVLRPWQRPDLDAMAAWPRFPDPIDDIWNWPHELQAHGTADLFFLSRAVDPSRREWTIATHDGTIVGQLHIREIDESKRSARLGIGFGYPYLGQGYGAEILCAFLDAFFGTLAFNQMYLDVSAYNERARRLYARLGFRELHPFWFEAGPVATYAFLDQPQYTAIRRFFAPGDVTMAVQYIEMRLAAAEWAGCAGSQRS